MSKKEIFYAIQSVHIASYHFVLQNGNSLIKRSIPSAKIEKKDRITKKTLKT